MESYHMVRMEAGLDISQIAQRAEKQARGENQDDRKSCLCDRKQLSWAGAPAGAEVCPFCYFETRSYVEPADAQRGRESEQDYRPERDCEGEQQNPPVR